MDKTPRHSSPCLKAGASWLVLVTDLNHVGVEVPVGILRNEVVTGWNEVSCHAGYRSSDFQSIYLSEREEEVRTLTDPRIRTALSEFGIVLVSYADLIPIGRIDG